jgi:type IV secretion system protein VirB7
MAMGKSYSVRIIRVLTIIGPLIAVSGCASLNYPLPKCDGYAKRPLNRSMWEWEGGKQPSSEQHSSLATESTPAMAFIPAQGEAQTHVAFAGLNEAGSHRACQAG